MAAVYLQQDLFVQSRYSQKIKNGFCFSFYEFLSSMQDENYPLDFLPGIQMICNTLGKNRLFLRIYEEGQFRGKEQTLFSDFLDIFHLQIQDGFQVSARQYNTSLSGTCLEIRRLLNQLSESVKDSPVLRKSLAAVQASRPSVPASFFHPEDRKQFLASFEPSNAEIARTFFGRTDGKLFYQEVPSSPKEKISADDLLRDTILVFGNALQRLEAEQKKLLEAQAESRSSKKKFFIFS